MNNENHLDAICAICGGRYGLHNFMNRRCPVDINSTADHTEYRETVFSEMPPSPSGANHLVEALENIAKGKTDAEYAEQGFEDLRKIARKALAQYNAVESEKEFDPMKIPDEYKTDDPIKAAVYWGWYHGLVNGHTHKFTWQEYQNTHPSQSPQTPIGREPEGIDLSKVFKAKNDYRICLAVKAGAACAYPCCNCEKSETKLQ